MTIKFRHFVAAIRTLFLKIRHGRSLVVNVRNVYIDPRARIEIRGGGRIEFESTGRRIFIERGTMLCSSGGVLKIHSGVYFNQNCVVVAYTVIEIGAESMVGPNVCILDGDHATDRSDVPFAAQGMKTSPISVGKNVWLSANVVVTKGSVIGNSTIVGANSVVRGDLKANSLYVGAPATFKRPIGVF